LPSGINNFSSSLHFGKSKSLLADLSVDGMEGEWGWFPSVDHGAWGEAVTRCQAGGRMNFLPRRFFGHVKSGGRAVAELFHDLRQSRGQCLDAEVDGCELAVGHGNDVAEMAPLVAQALRRGRDPALRRWLERSRVPRRDRLCRHEGAHLAHSFLGAAQQVAGAGLPELLGIDHAFRIATSWGKGKGILG